LILFSDIDGVYDKNPKEFPDAALIEEVRDIEALKKNISIGSANDFGTGGIATKLDAAQLAIQYGIPTILAHGNKGRSLEALAAGSQKGTVFLT
jgi:glutamate 5-kinase